MPVRRTVPARPLLGPGLVTALPGALAGLIGLALAGCASTPAVYTLGAGASAAPARPGAVSAGSPSDVTGSLSVEATQSGQKVVVVQLAELPPPERLGSGLTEFVVWLEDEHGHRVKAGVLRYDRARHSGNLLATTDLSAFTVQVTGERSEDVSSPSDVLVVERKVRPN